MCNIIFFGFFFFNDTATTEIYTLSLHDALPISAWAGETTAVSNFPQQEDGEGGEGGEGEDGLLTTDAELVEVVVAKVAIPPEIGRAHV